MAIAESFSRRFFGYVHGNNLIYNACWEDPRLDREALQLGSGDRLMMITSAGCNALDYLLAGAGSVHCVDLNPRQNALLELKAAGIRRLEFDDFFRMFGLGRWESAAFAYWEQLRSELSPASRRYWDRHIDFFSGEGRRRSFYFRGATGYFAWLMNVYIDRVARLRSCVDEILAATELDEQRAIYEELRPRLWRRLRSLAAPPRCHAGAARRAATSTAATRARSQGGHRPVYRRLRRVGLHPALAGG